MGAGAHGIVLVYDPGDRSRIGSEWLVSEEVFEELRAELAERLGPPSLEHFSPSEVLDEIAGAVGKSVTLTRQGD